MKGLRTILSLLLTASAAPGLVLAGAANQELSTQAVEILKTRCSQCHSNPVAMAELRLDTREGLLKGGVRGPAVKPGDARGSLLYQAVTGAVTPAMPPTGKIPEEEVATLARWIDDGAKWSDLGPSVSQSSWWSFQKPERPPVPRPTGNPIDAFILEKLEEQNLKPAQQADKRTLARRAYFDLHGLPPTPEQARAFVDDTSPNAWERLIDQLLASPRYGEKWGRHWLDLVRYGDTSGFEQDPYLLLAWRYRDYVIASFNEDKPYDRFVKEQLAADEIWPQDAAARTGTGFFRVGANRDMLFKVEEINRVEKLTDYVSTTSLVFLGLTVGCARCHDHKFDPIPQRDFYRMQAIFEPAVSTNVFLDYNAARFYDIAEVYRDFRLWQTGSEIQRIFAPYQRRLVNEKLARLPAEVQEAFRTDGARRTLEQEALVTQHVEDVKVSDDDIRAALSASDAERLDAIERRLVGMFKGYGPPPASAGLMDGGGVPPHTYVALRGNAETPGERVEAGFLSVLGGGDIPDSPEHASSTFRRRALAEWVTSPENPLTTRVIVNRIWQYHFGAGLVDTPSDFGTRGGKPSHPALLDWLATEFVARGWSIKDMHRLIMTSDVYRRDSAAPPEAVKRDPENVYLSRMNRRRLQAEEIRDAALSAAGNLNLKTGGPPVVPPLTPEEMYGIIGNPANAWPVTPDEREHTRRSVYLLSRRTFAMPMFSVFDQPDGVMSCERRDSSTTAPQSLTLLNSAFMAEQAHRLGENLTGVEDAWWRVLGRAPSEKEKEWALEFLEAQGRHQGSEPAARAELARSLLNLNEFLYVD